MRVVFVSNYYNHHQAPFSEAMDRLTNGEYWFVATERMSEERKSMGWQCGVLPRFVLQPFENDVDRKKSRAVIDEADVVLFGLNGWNNYKLIINRLRQGKLTFRYSERLYKSGFPQYKTPIQAVKLWLAGGKYRNMYLLCASAYAAGDYAKTGTYIGRTYKWGYFPGFKQYDLDDLMGRKLSTASDCKHPKVSILWAGRLIEWKHPEVAIRLAEKLKRRGYEFKLSLIGNGAMEEPLRQMIREKQLEDCVSMLGTMSPEAVRGHMEQADIFLFTSDFNEGWGAVLNEAMNSGCAVVASHAIGAVPFLIRDGANGLIYENGNQEQFEERVCRLLENEKLRRKLGENAYKSIEDTWNADNAARRLLVLGQKISEQGNRPGMLSEGPCSDAEALSENWYGCRK